MANGYGPPDPWRLGGTWGPTGVPSLLSPSAIDEEEWERRLREMELARRQQEARGQRVPANYQPTTAQPSLFQEALEAQSQRQGFTLGDWQQQERARQQAQRIADARATMQQRADIPVPRGVPEGAEVVDGRLAPIRRESEGLLSDLAQGVVGGVKEGYLHGAGTMWNLLGKLPGATEAEQERYDRLATGSRRQARESAGGRPETTAAKTGQIIADVGLLAGTYGGSRKLTERVAQSLLKHVPRIGRRAVFGKETGRVLAPNTTLSEIWPTLSPGRKAAAAATLGTIYGAGKLLAPATKLGTGIRNIAAFAPMDILLASDPENVGFAPMVDAILGTDVNSAWWKRAVANLGGTAAMEALIGIAPAAWKALIREGEVPPGARQAKETLKEQFSLTAGETPTGLLAKPVEPHPVTGDVSGYRGVHLAPTREYGSPLHAMDEMYPADIYGPDAARLYGQGGDQSMDVEIMQQIQSFRGRPDAMVTVYRALPQGAPDTINPGDWVTPSRRYAEGHARIDEDPLNDLKIIEKEVRADELFSEGNSPYEFGYSPQEAGGLLPKAVPPREFKGSVLQQEKPWTAEVGKVTPESQRGWDASGYRVRGPAASADDALRPETMGSMLDEGYTSTTKTAVPLAGNRRSAVLEHIEQGPKKATWDQWAQHLTRKKGLKQGEVNMVLSRMRAPRISGEELRAQREVARQGKETFPRAVPEGLILREDVEALVRDIYGDLAVVELDEVGLSRGLQQHFEDREVIGDPEYGPSEDDWNQHIERLEYSNLMLSPSIGNPQKSWAGGLSRHSNSVHDIQGTGRLRSSFTASRPIGFEIVDKSLVSQGYRDSHFGNPGAIVHVRMIEPAYSLDTWGVSRADVRAHYDKAFPEGRFGQDQHGEPWKQEVQAGITPVEAHRMGLKDPERIHGLHPRSWVVGEIQSDRGQQLRERAILSYGNDEFERIANRRIEESGLRYGKESAARIKIKQNLYEELLKEAKVPALVDPSAQAAKKERLKAYGVLWRRAKTDVRDQVLDAEGREMGLGPLEEVPFQKTEQQMRLAVDEILQRAAQNNIREVVFPTEAQINRVYEGEATNPGGPYAQILPRQIKAAAKSIGATVKQLDLDNPANYDRAKLWRRTRLVPSQIRGREGEDPYYRQSDHGNQPRAEHHPDYGEGDLGTRVDKNTVVEIPDELARRMRGEIPGEEVSTKIYGGALGDVSGLLGVGMEDESPDEFTAQDLLRLGLLGFAGSQAARGGRRTAKPAVSQKAAAAVRRIDKFDPKLKARLRTEYPATVVSKVMTFDPDKNNWFFAKVKSDEQKLLEPVVSDINKDIAAGNYTPFFDVSERRLADPTSYGLLENIKEHGDVGYPKADSWVKKHNAAFNTPEARERIEAAYNLVEGNELARLWYGMGQLQDFFIDQLGQEAGLRAFDDRFAKGLSITTAGQAPFANLRTAAYADFQSARDLPMPRQLKPAGLKPGDPRLVETDLGMQRRNLETGELEWPEKPPYPVGGRFGADNLATYEKVMGEGGGLLTAQKPKEFSFRGSLLGEEDLMAAIDEQMMVGMYPAQPGAVQRKAPPGTAYRIIRDVVGDVANDIGTSLVEMQAVGWSGFKTRSDALTGYAKELGKKNASALTPKEREQALQSKSFDKAWAEIRPMIQIVNEAIERTARLTGQTPLEVATRWVLERAPLYGIAGLIAAGMSQEESN